MRRNKHVAKKKVVQPQIPSEQLFFIARNSSVKRLGAMEKSAEVPRKTYLFFAGLVSAYLTLNSLLNLTNKWVLSSSTGYGFTFPLALTCCHMAFSFVALLPYMLGKSMRGTHRKSVEKQWKGLVAIGVLMAANIAFNNSSLVNMSLSLNQIIRYGLLAALSPPQSPSYFLHRASTNCSLEGVSGLPIRKCCEYHPVRLRASIPVVTAIVAVVVEHQVPGKGEASGLLVLTGGVMLSVYSSLISIM